MHMHAQEDCEHLWAEGIKTTEDLMELELEDITAMGRALSLSTKKRLTRFSQLSREVRVSLSHRTHSESYAHINHTHNLSYTRKVPNQIRPALT